MDHKLNFWIIISWIFGIGIFVIGVLNMLLVHPIPGIIYLFISLIYVPPIYKILVKNLGFSIPLIAKIILGFIILWVTLGVGDLAEMFGL